MSATQYIPDAEFAPAPTGTRVRLATLVSAVVVLFATTVAFVLIVRDHNPPPGLVVGAIGVIPIGFGLGWLTARIRRYRLVGDELRIALQYRTLRFPLAGLVSAAADREAMRGAWKVYGDGGLAAISGRYRSKRLGSFRAYLTDSEHAVVLRWPDRCLVISPQQHSFFVETVCKRAGLPR